MQKRIISFWLLAACLSSGCAATQAIRLTVKTIPPGATVIAGGTNYGTAPVTINYPLSGKYRIRDTVTTGSVYAYWADGSKAGHNSVTHDFSNRYYFDNNNGFGSAWWNQEITIIQPKTVSPRRAQQQQQQQQQQQTIIVPGMGSGSGNDCVKECKKMYLKGELKEGSSIEECIQLLCM